jgi:tetratricopeptide (TPR) repeat protein
MQALYCNSVSKRFAFSIKPKVESSAMDFRWSVAVFCGLVAGAIPSHAAGTGETWIQTGLAQETAGRYEEAIDSFTKALETDEMSTADRVRAVYDRGVAHDALGRILEALQDYTDALRLDAKFAPALNNRANAYRRLGKPDEAKRDYWAALTVPGSGHEYSYYGLGQIAESQEDEDLARSFYGRALKINPQFTLVAQCLDDLNKRVPPAPPKPPPAGSPTVEPPQIEPEPTAVAAAPQPVAAMPEPAPAVPDTPVAQGGPALPAAGADVPVLRLGVTSHRPAAEEKSAKEKQLEAKIAAAKREVVALKQVAARRQRQTPQAGTAEVQLAAFRSRGEAEAGWDQVKRRAGDILNGRDPKIVEVVLPEKGRYFRLRLAAGGRREADDLCTALKAKGQDCLSVKE